MPHANRFAWGLVPAAAWLALFFLIPMLLMASVSVLTQGEPVTTQFDGSSYNRIFEDVHLKIIFRSLVYALATTAICLLIGYPLAYAIVRSSARAQRWLFFLVLIPLWANSLVLIYAWIVLLRPDGLVELALRVIGLSSEDDPVAILYTPTAVIIGLVYWSLPFMVYPIYASLSKFDFQLVDAAANLGASPWQSTRRILIPLTQPGIIVGCTLVFIETLGTFVVPDLLGGAKTMMIGNLIQQRFLSFPQDWPLGSALSVSIALAFVAGYAIFIAYRRRVAK